MNIRRTIGLSAAAAGLAIGVVPAAAAAAAPTRITGVITVDGTPQAGVTVQLLEGEDSQGVIKTATTTASGTFTFSGGIDSHENIGHTLFFDDPDQIVGGGKSVRVKAGTTVRADIAAEPAGSITGTVSRPGGASGPTTVQVSGPYVTRGNPDDSRLVYDSVIQANSTGQFTAGGLPAGEYRLTYIDDSGQYFPVCHDGSATTTNEFGDKNCSHAAPLVVSRGGSITAPSAAFDRAAASLTGRVSGVTGGSSYFTYAEVYRRGSDELVSSNPLTAQRDFRAVDLPAGQWDVLIAPSDPAVEPRWFTASPTRAGATAVTTTEGERVNGIDVRLRSRSAVTIKATGGVGRATFAIAVKRQTTGSTASGAVRVTVDGVTQKVALASGKATATLKGLPKGKRSYKVTYSGSADTASQTRTGTVTVG